MEKSLVRRPFTYTFYNAAFVIIGINIYMVFVQIINFSLGSNYMWIARKPDFPSLIDHLGPWPWYILSMVALGFGICLILYLPFIVRDRIKKPHNPIHY